MEEISQAGLRRTQLPRGALPGTQVTAGLRPAGRTLPSSSGTCTGSGPAAGMPQRRAGATSQPDPPGPWGGCLPDSGCVRNGPHSAPVPLSLPLSVSASLSPSLTPPTHTSLNWNSHLSTRQGAGCARVKGDHGDLFDSGFSLIKSGRGLLLGSSVARKPRCCSCHPSQVKETVDRPPRASGAGDQGSFAMTGSQGKAQGWWGAHWLGPHPPGH